MSARLFADIERRTDMWLHERLFAEKGLAPVAGVDEVGRGCLAGPVVAAAVILPCSLEDQGVTDSKLLTPAKRERLERLIRQRATAVAIAQVDAKEIDSINILRAALKAMSLALDGLEVRPRAVLVDGNQPIPHPLPQKTIVHGDSISCSISAASIVAKVYRDKLMEKFSDMFPQYNFKKHKGYATREHRQALKLHGPCPLHRRSFKGVQP